MALSFDVAARPFAGVGFVGLLRCNARTTKLSQSELSCLKANCVAITPFNFIIAARAKASVVLLTRLGCDKLLRSETQTN